MVLQVRRFQSVPKWVKNDEVTLYYTSMGNDVSIVLTKKDDDHVTGKAMGAYDATGERVKQILQ